MSPRETDRQVQNGLRRAVLTARRAIGKVAGAGTLRELACLGEIEVDPLVRLMASGLPELHQLEIAVLDRAAQIVTGHLLRLERVIEAEGQRAFEAVLDGLRREHWGYLHGPRAPLRDALEDHVTRIRGRGTNVV